MMVTSLLWIRRRRIAASCTERLWLRLTTSRVSSFPDYNATRMRKFWCRKIGSTQLSPFQLGIGVLRRGSCGGSDALKTSAGLKHSLLSFFLPDSTVEMFRSSELAD